MSRMLPFGLPGPTALYLSLYILSMAVHLALMSYVIAGSATLAWAAAASRLAERRSLDSPLTRLLRDWMPIALGTAITAGVAPLLFVQILYRETFYTANLLLFHRWMPIVPALIAGFYLLYLLRGPAMTARSGSLRVLAGAGAFACFAFTGFSWTENHLLSLLGQAGWARFYGSGAVFHFETGLPARLGIWFFGAFPTLGAIAAWQLTRASGTGFQPQVAAGAEPGRGETARDFPLLAGQALAGSLGAMICAAWYWSQLDEAPRAALRTVAAPYAALALLGWLLQAAGWARLLMRRRWGRASLTIISLGCAMTIVGMLAAREAVRLAAIDLETLYSRHAAAAEVGGLGVFAFFFIANGMIIWWSLRRVRRSLRSPLPPPSRSRSQG